MSALGHYATSNDDAIMAASSLKATPKADIDVAKIAL
jgi:hypothetical protein